MKALSSLFKYTLLCLAWFSLHSCASLNKDECQNANWRVIGYEDASRGQRSDRIGEHRSACAKYGISPDLTTYQMGFKEGLEAFCKPQRGYHFGLQGANYQGTCPAYLEQDFLPAYNYGKDVYSTSSKLNTIKSQQQSMINKIGSLNKTIKEKEQILVNYANSPAQRQALLDEIKDLTKQRDAVQKTVDDLDYTIDDMGRLLARLKERSPYQ